MRGQVIQGSFPAGARQGARATQLSPRLAMPPPLGGQPLPPGVRQMMEAAFRQRFDDVRIHVGHHARTLGAVAFTQGSHIHFAPGHYNPDTPRGREVLAHELAHVVQQRTGRVRNPFGSGVALMHDAQLEAEAARAAAHAVRQPAMRQPAVAAPAVVQRTGIFATLATIGTAALWWTGFSLSTTTPLGLLAAYLVYRQTRESVSYRSGVRATERQQREIVAPTCEVVVLRSMRYKLRTEDWGDDHISIAVEVNGRVAKTGGFWIRGGGKPEMAIGSQGTVKSDAEKFEAERKASRRIKVTPEQAQAIIERITHDEQHPPRFDPSGYLGYTCVTWATSVLKSGGITLSTTNWLLPPYPENVVELRGE